MNELILDFIKEFESNPVYKSNTTFTNLYFRSCKVLNHKPKISNTNIFGGQLEVCCHVINYDFEYSNIEITKDLQDNIEEEIKKIIELAVCKNKDNGCIDLDVESNGNICHLFGGWEILK